MYQQKCLRFPSYHSLTHVYTVGYFYREHGVGTYCNCIPRKNVRRELAAYNSYFPSYKINRAECTVALCE